jgi:hypothetical protein
MLPMTSKNTTSMNKVFADLPVTIFEAMPGRKIFAVPPRTP